MDLEKLKNKAFEIAKAHGWHDDELPDETYLMLIITEIAEAVQADRAENYADRLSFDIQMSHGEDFETTFDVNIKNSIEDELSDIVIRCLDLAGLYDIGFDLAHELLDKGMQEVKETFPEVMYHTCTFVSSDEETLSDKLNYCVALVIGYCRQKDIEIEWLIEQKMKYNKLRPYKHGNKKY